MCRATRQPSRTLRRGASSRRGRNRTGTSTVSSPARAASVRHLALAAEAADKSPVKRAMRRTAGMSLDCNRIFRSLAFPKEAPWPRRLSSFPQKRSCRGYYLVHFGVLPPGKPAMAVIRTSAQLHTHEASALVPRVSPRSPAALSWRTDVIPAFRSMRDSNRQQI